MRAATGTTTGGHFTNPRWVAHLGGWDEPDTANRFASFCLRATEKLGDLMDNFEWALGYRPKFGLIAVDRTTFERTPKPSAAFLGKIARANSL